MKKIKLTKGQFAIVDDEDFEKLNKYKWWMNKVYATRATRIGGYKNRKTIWMHRLINNTPDGFDTDHINGNKLDNRRSNLRTVTRSQNNANTGVSKNNKVGLKGVSWSKSNQSWFAEIMVNYKRIRICGFKNPIDAAKKYNELALEYFGEFAFLNNI